MTGECFDVAIIGAGPGGLSAALWLGRCGRLTVVYDGDDPRNKASRALHGYLTRDGMAPLELRRSGRRELSRYPSVELRHAEIHKVRRSAAGFELTTTSGTTTRSRLLLLATGRHDDVPAIPGFAKLYGRGIYHCPYCDGWEHRGETLAVYDPRGEGLGLVKVLKTWSQDIVLCTDGEKPTARAGRLGVRILSEKIARAHGNARGRLCRLSFLGGGQLTCSALFFCSHCIQKSQLPEAIGCRLDDTGSVVCRSHAAVGVPDLYVAGNVRGGVHLAITAAAEGAEAALAMNDRLLTLTRQQKGLPERRRLSRRGKLLSNDLYG